MSESISCPKCCSLSTKHIPEIEKYLCLTCAHLFIVATGEEKKYLKVFLSYGHDVFAEDVYAIKKDLESRGHKVWYDVEKLKAGREIDFYIERGLQDSDVVVLVMTPHSVRRLDTKDPKSSTGYCLNELAKAYDLNKRIIPVYLVTVPGDAPVPISRLGWVDMRDCVHFHDFPDKYRYRFTRLIDAIENDKYDEDGAQSRLLRLLKPLAFETEMGRHLPRFSGRQWVTAELNKWLADPAKKDSRVFWLLGGAGVGKSAIASHWCHTRGDVIAYHLCVYGHSEKADPKRILLSLAGQMAMHLAEYFKRLTALPLEDLVNKNAKAVFDDLILAPLKANFPDPGRTLLVIIDALDEANNGKENELADFISESWGELPPWLRLVITSRPETAVMTRLAALQPWPLKAETADNLHDIRECLKKEFAKIAPTVSEAVIEQIVGKSEGLFLYANLVLDEVRAGKLSLDVLSEFPSGLAGYYNRWFKREFPDLVEYENIYNWIVSTTIAQRAPLPLTVLGEALELSPYELRKRLQKLTVLFPLREERSGEYTTTYIVPLHKSLREWLTEPIPGTEVPKAGSYTADIASGDRLLAERGWMIYSEGKMAINPYYSRTLLRHLADTGQLKRLTEVLLDGELMEALWAGEQRCEWLRHMNVLRESVSLSKTIHEWLATRLSKGTATLEDAGKMSILSRMLQQLGAFDEAIHVAEQAIRIWELNGVTESPSMVQSLLSLGTIHRHRDEYGAALPYYDRALAIAEGTHNPNSRELADVLYELCVFHKETRNYEKSWECLNRCLAIRKQIEPPDYAGIADCINDRAVLLSAEGKPADLMSIYLEALSLFEKGYPDGHPEMATTLNNIAIELLKEGKSDDALATLRRGLRMAESLLIKYHPKCKSLRKDLVDLLHKKEKYQEALQLMRQQVIQSEIFPGPFHENTADIRLRLCQTIWEVFRFDEKFPREQLMVEIREQCSKVTSAHPFTVIGLLQASDKYYQTSEREVSQCLFDAACRGARGNAEKVTKDTAENIASKCFADFLDLLCSSDSFVDLRKQLLDVWGQAVPKVRDYGDSLARMRREVIRLISWSGQSRLLRMRDVTQVTSAFDLISEIGADTPETLDVLAALTVALHHQRYFMESERLCAQLAERSESMLGHNHLQTIQYVANLADLREHREDFEEAARLYLRVFETRRRIYGDQNEDTLFSLSCVAKCLLLDGRFGDAAALVHEIAENMPSSDAGNTARHVLALNLNGRAIELKNELSAFDAARKCYELSLELSPDDQVHTNLALLLWSCLKDIKEAEMHFQKAAKLNPDNGNLHTIYGLFLTHELLDNAKAQMHFEKADSLIPNENAHPGNRATLSIVQGDLDKSWKFAKRAMHLCLPKPDRIMARPLFCAAAVLLLKGSDAAIPLGQLRTLFDQGIDHVSWVTNALLDKLENELTPEFGQLMRSISDAINSKPAYQKLEANPVWLAIRPVGLDMPWPEM